MRGGGGVLWVLLASVLWCCAAAASLPPPAHPALPVSQSPLRRVIAIGDVHGDVSALHRVLRAARVIDDALQWCAGNDTALVQTGDILDRGDGEVLALDLLYALQRQVSERMRAGTLRNAHVVLLLGNHELMAATGDTRYATHGCYASYRAAVRGPRAPPLDADAGWLAVAGAGAATDDDDSVAEELSDDGPLAHVPAAQRARAAALRPGGVLARRLARTHHAVAIVEDALYVHGGVLLPHVARGGRADLALANEAQRAFLRGDLLEGRALVMDAAALEASGGHALDGGAHVLSDERRAALGDALRMLFADADAMLWTRRYSSEPSAAACNELREVLARLEVSRLVVGHTPQPAGIRTVCDGAAVLIDTGMSAAYGGPAQALIIDYAAHGGAVESMRVVDAATV